MCSCGAACLIAVDKLISCTKTGAAAMRAGLTQARDRVPRRNVRGRRAPQLSPEQVAAAQDLVADGARIADVADMYNVPYHVVQRATVGVAVVGRKRKGATMARGDVERALLPGGSMIVPPGTLEGPAVELHPGARAKVLAYWRGMAREYCRRMPQEAIETCAMSALDPGGVVALATVRKILRETLLTMAAAGTPHDDIARDLHTTAPMVARTVAEGMTPVLPVVEPEV